MLGLEGWGPSVSIILLAWACCLVLSTPDFLGLVSQALVGPWMLCPLGTLSTKEKFVKVGLSFLLLLHKCCL